MTGALTAHAYRSRRDAQPVLTPRHEPVVWGEASDGPLSAAELETFDRAGVLSESGLLDEGEAEALLDEVERLATDPILAASELAVLEPDGSAVRSVFAAHEHSDLIHQLATDDRLAGRARQILGSDVVIHQARVNRKPGFRGREFYWHSDFETWHLEDGMSTMRALSISVALTSNDATNGGLLVMPGSHRTFVGCVGDTPDGHYRTSLRDQRIGVPDEATLSLLARRHGIDAMTGPPGSAVLFDSNIMHGSNGNITPFPRSNVFLVYRSVDNELVEPFGGTAPRPDFLAHRRARPLPVGTGGPLGR